MLQWYDMQYEKKTKYKHAYANESTDSEIGPVWQNPIRQAIGTIQWRQTISGRAFPVATAAAWIWNMLPLAITSLPSLQTFKRALKKELFRRSYDNTH